MGQQPVRVRGRDLQTAGRGHKKRPTRWRSGRLGLALVALTAAGVGACQSRGSQGAGRTAVETQTSALTSATTAAQILTAAQAQPGSPVQPAVAQGFASVSGGLLPQFSAAALSTEAKPAIVLVPQLCTAPLHLADVASGAAVDISLNGALAVAAQAVGGYVVYPAAFGLGATVLHRALPGGSEDFVSFSTRPATPEVDYSVALGAGIAGLRLVAGTLEMLDASGAPRLHVSPPYIVGADGARTDGALAVSDCTVDSNPSAPWGRAVTAPGGSKCTVHVTWPDASVIYPAILDPRWTTTGSMGTARFEHTLTLLSTGRALVAGGRSTSSGTTGLTSAELYDQTSGTWSATGSMSGGRRLQSMTQLPTSSNPTTSGKILVAGGISGTTSLATAELYSPSAGTWISAGALNAARHAHTATLLVDGRVLIAGGLNGTTALATAALYSPASGAGSWVATTGPIPPAGLKNHTATLIQTTNTQLNNHVLLVGGNNGTSTIAAVYLFDPVQNAFSTLASISSPREQHTASTLVNSNGKILVTGGKNGSTVLATALIFDPSVSNGTWSAAGTMTSPRVGHSMTLLPSSIVANGQFLVAGGSSTGSNTLSSAEMFSGTSTWTATPSMPAAITGHAAVLLGSNTILTAGGLNGSTVLTSAFLYDATFGLSCSTNSQCASGFCAQGVCCDTACNGGSCSACNLAGKLGTCSAIPNGTVCRAAAGACDVAETCNGTAFTCPADALAPSTTTCRATAGACDVAENCTGSSVNCPADAKKSSGTACTDDGIVCTKDQCDGTAVTCQHPAGNAGTVCRASAGACDVAETCTGTSATCPTDGFLSASTVCRGTAGECDVAETCTGTSASCPADGKKASGTACIDDGNVCTTDQCNGTNVTCQHPAGNAGTICRASAGPCDVAENCTGTSTACPANGFLPPTTVCRLSTDQCDVAENCTGSSANCPADGRAANGTACNDSNACTQTDTCQSGACVGGNPVLFGVPESDPNAAKCADGTAPVGCRGFDCNTGLSAAWLAAPACSQSISCIASCLAAGCVQQNQRAGTVVQCDCSCADPTGGVPLSLTIQRCGISATPCSVLCAGADEACSSGNCIANACVPAAGASPETVMESSCRASDDGIVTLTAPFTGVLDPTTSRVAVNIGGHAISGSATGAVGFSSGAISSGTFALTSLQAKVLGPIQFFGRRIDSLQVALRRPLFAAEQPDEAGKHFAVIVHPEDLATQVVVGGVARFLSLDAIGSLSGTFNSDRTIFTLTGAQTQPTGDSISVNLTALTTNSPPQPTITVAPGSVLECTGHRAASATFSASTVDPDPGASIKRIQWVVGKAGPIDDQLTVLGAGSIVTASLSLGEHLVTGVAYDQHEAAGRATVDVQVRDTIAPIVSAPPDETFYAGVGGTSVEVNLGAANVQETCDSSPKVSVVTSLDPDSPLRGVPIPNPGDVVLPVGQIPIVWTVIDSSGNTGSAVQTVRVLAQSAPAGTPDPPPLTIPAPACSGGAMPVSPPGSLPVSVDVRVCVVGRINAGVREGSAPWENCSDDACTDSAIQSLLAPANMYYSGFVSFNYMGVKRIRDPYPPQPDKSEPDDPCGTDGVSPYHYGDACLRIGLNSDAGIEANMMRTDCYAAWGYPPPTDLDSCQRGIILVLVRGIDINSQAPGVCGMAIAPVTMDPSICDDPRTLSENTSGAFAIVPTSLTGTFGQNDCSGSGPFAVAHELGHTLGLGHGDGLDDDCSGAWDDPCDKAETETGPMTLMDKSSEGATSFLTPLQLDRARIYATKSLPAAASSTSVCPTVSLPQAPGDTPAPPAPPPSSGCGCSVAGAEGSIWLVALIGFVILSRRRMRARR